ncbi:MAG TPA: trypsin-like peptidase domain-containing protein, partial [Jatrophihabitantaceae bacterium]|nr:trypsin-like peptidase domain-containing protein [Jatrophihabitantaceae bacterium]
MTSNYPYPEPYGTGEPQYGDYADPASSGSYGGYPPVAPPPPPTPPSKPNRKRRMFAAGVALLAAGALAGGLAVAANEPETVGGRGSAQAIVPEIPGDMNRKPGGTSASVSLATAAQQKGVVTIVSVLKYESAESAGTGMILTPTGEILTNNHVVRGATQITVTVASTGREYRADVVGTDPSDDVAVLQLRKASGLQTANIGDSSDVSSGDDIVGVGNAGGTGTLRASAGTVTALNQSITARDETGQNAEKLTGLIKVHAAIVSGDSGGPLYDSSGEIIGMDTAASTTQLVDHTAYAIPINSAIAIADKIESGVETNKIHIGLPAFLGVSVHSANGRGALVQGLLPGGPAADAGIAPGSVVTAVDGKKVTSPDSLKALLQAYNPGDR